MTALETPGTAWGMTLILLLAVACAGPDGPRPDPTPVIRAGDLYTCANGVDGCRVTYEIGPVTAVGDRLRIDFYVIMEGPAGGTTTWTNDPAYHEFMKSQGQRGIVLTLAADSEMFYELDGAGGIAAIDELLIAPVTYWGFWEFTVTAPPGALLYLTYPDFIDTPAPIVVPD